MATQFPIDPDFNRFIDGVTTMPQGMAPEMDADEMEVIEQPDGSAIVTMKGEEEGETDFYENLAESISPMELNSLAMRYLDLIDKDKEARKDRDKKYEEGLKRTGLGNDAPGGAQFQGASKVVHPIMAEACVDFASRAMKELFPPSGPTRTRIVGEATHELG